MSAQVVEQLNFDFLPHLPVIVQPHRGQITSDAGLLPIAQFDRRWNYTARMAACLDDGPRDDPRQKHRTPQTDHQRIEMLRQRLFGVLAGYEDCNDHDTVITKAECHSQGTNLRFVVTNRPGVASASDGEHEYDDYIQRGESEQRMDELKNGLKMDRLSCPLVWSVIPGTTR